MERNVYAGKFLVIEGLDGSGQSTQMRRLANFLKKRGKDVLATKEPTTDSETGRRIRDFLVNKNVGSAKEFQKLFAQDRAEHLRTTIIPALQADSWVVSDRYFFTSFAYGTGEGVDLEYLLSINESFLLPDKAFFLRVAPKECMARIQKRGGDIEYFERLEHLRKAWQVFEALAKKFENTHIINGEQPIEKVAHDIQAIVEKDLL